MANGHAEIVKLKMIKINCLICGKEIKNPRVGQLLCGSKECKKKYIRNRSMEEVRKNTRKKWRNSSKGKAWSKEYYKRPEVKKRIDEMRKINQEATKQLKERHVEEFQILKRMIQNKQKNKRIK